MKKKESIYKSVNFDICSVIDNNIKPVLHKQTGTKT